MTSKDFVIDAMRRQGKTAALALQAQASSMTGTELNAEDNYIPDFQKAKAIKNMLNRSAGFVCKSSEGRVVKLIQPYDSDIYTDEPESLSAQWGFVWSKDPAKAKPFIALSTSPYDTGDCCIENDIVYRSNMDGNVWAPSAYAQGWDEVKDGE